jgi:hypothetical protein
MTRMPSSPSRCQQGRQVEVRLSEALPSPAQCLAWQRLWALLLADDPPSSSASSGEPSTREGRS